jgi:hypothetical protein
MSRSFGIAAGPVRARRWSGADAPGDLVRLLVDLDLSEADAAQRPAFGWFSNTQAETMWTAALSLAASKLRRMVFPFIE